MARMLLTVSRRVSPLVTEEAEAEKLSTSAESLFSANSNEMRVLVEFSKKRFTIVMSLSDGTFLIGRLMTSMNWSAVSKINSISFRVRSLIPRRCFVLNCCTNLFLFKV